MMSGIEIPKKKTERGSFQVFNVKYENIYETENETIVLLSKNGGELILSGFKQGLFGD